MPGYAVEFPEGFDDFAWEVESKGWFQGAIAVVAGRRYSVTFYDPVRLAQDIETELKERALFFERNMIVVPSVTRAHMEAAIEAIARAGRHIAMIPELDPG